MLIDERWVKEVTTGEGSNPWHSRVHVIKDTTYRQSISWGGFFSYKHTRNHIDRWKHFFRSYFPDDYEMELEQAERLKSHGVEMTWEWIYHEDLYAFYDYIGYNRHTKKFERS